MSLRCFALFFVGVLSGCAGLSPEREELVWEAEPEVVFHVEGRLSVKHEDEAFISRFDWRHTDATDYVAFFSPMGGTLARLTREGENITLQQGEDASQTQRTKDWEAFTQKNFGFPLPISSLVYWMRGAPAPGVSAVVMRDKLGRMDSVRQHGWVIQYRYLASSKLPERLDAQYGETISLRMKIDRWLDEE